MERRSLQGNPGRGGGGGLLRDSRGRWAAGFMIRLGLCTFVLAEFTALVELFFFQNTHKKKKEIEIHVWSSKAFWIFIHHSCCGTAQFDNLAVEIGMFNALIIEYVNFIKKYFLKKI